MLELEGKTNELRDLIDRVFVDYRLSFDDTLQAIQKKLANKALFHLDEKTRLEAKRRTALFDELPTINEAALTHRAWAEAFAFARNLVLEYAEKGGHIHENGKTSPYPRAACSICRPEKGDFLRLGFSSTPDGVKRSYFDRMLSLLQQVLTHAVDAATKEVRVITDELQCEATKGRSYDKVCNAIGCDSHIIASFNGLIAYIKDLRSELKHFTPKKDEASLMFVAMSSECDRAKRLKELAKRNPLKDMSWVTRQPAQLTVEELPVEKLLATTDAQVWAEQFAAAFGGDVSDYVGWFANAIETGRDAGVKDMTASMSKDRETTPAPETDGCKFHTAGVADEGRGAVAG